MKERAAAPFLQYGTVCILFSLYSIKNYDTDPKKPLESMRGDMIYQRGSCGLKPRYCCVIE